MWRAVGAGKVETRREGRISEEEGQMHIGIEEQMPEGRGIDVGGRRG